MVVVTLLVMVAYLERYVEMMALTEFLYLKTTPVALIKTLDSDVNVSERLSRSPLSNSLDTSDVLINNSLIAPMLS